MTDWGINSPGKSARKQLFEHVLDSMIVGEVYGAAGWVFDLVLQYRSDCGGDPLWTSDHIPEPGGEGHFRLWAGERITGIEPEDGTYTVEEVFAGLEEGLRAHAARYPDMRPEAEAALASLPRYRQRFAPRNDTPC